MKQGKLSGGTVSGGALLEKDAGEKSMADFSSTYLRLDWKTGHSKILASDYNFAPGCRFNVQQSRWLKAAVFPKAYWAILILRTTGRCTGTGSGKSASRRKSSARFFVL